MKNYCILFAFICSTICFGQNATEIEYLTKIGEFYSTHVSSKGREYKKALKKYRTPGLNHIIDVLIAVGNADKELLTATYLAKPTAQELKYWYVIRQIHYNNSTDNKNPLPVAEVVSNTLAKDIDSRWLLDNYYFGLQGGIAKLFNNADLSNININLNEYNLANDTEKAICYFQILNGLLVRFRVLNMVKNYERLLAYNAKLPSINGSPYYEYTNFEFDDFDYENYEGIQSYKTEKITDLYLILNAHLGAVTTQGFTADAKNIYFNSILFEPDYFKYAGDLKADLEEVYNKVVKK